MKQNHPFDLSSPTKYSPQSVLNVTHYQSNTDPYMCYQVLHYVLIVLIY